jgi:hypothetical protein
MGAFWWHTFRATVISFRLFALNVETQQCYVTHYPIGLPTLRPSWCNLWFSNFGDFGNPGSPERPSFGLLGRNHGNFGNLRSVRIRAQA